MVSEDVDIGKEEARRGSERGTQKMNTRRHCCSGQWLVQRTSAAASVRRPTPGEFCTEELY